MLFTRGASARLPLLAFRKKQHNHLSLHIITMNRARYLERILYKCWWCFDNIRICDGGSEDNTLDICKKFGCDIVENEWHDDMSEQHNQLLKLASEGEWIFILDDDEYPSDELMFRFKELIADSKHDLYHIPSIIEIDGILQCSVPEMIDKIQNQGHEQFSKDILFKYYNELHYEGASHYALKGYEFWHDKRIPEPIIHMKTPEDIIWCDMYQGFINPETQGYSKEDGQSIKDLFSKVGVTTVPKLKLYLEKGNIEPELKERFAYWKSPDNDSKSRWYQWYFLVLHPEELPDEYGLMNDAILRYLRDKGGLRSYSIWDKGEEFLPIGHLDIPDELRRRIDTNLVLISPRKWSAQDAGAEGQQSAGTAVECDSSTASERLGAEGNKHIMRVPEFGYKDIVTENDLRQLLSERSFMGNEYDLLFKHTMEIDGDIIEIGAYHGASTAIFGAVFAFRDVEWKVYSIDIEKSYYPHSYNSMHEALQNGTARLRMFTETIMRVGAEEMVIPILCSSQIASEFMDVKPMLVYVDGNHDFENCSFDISTWGEKLLPGGIILVHDYHPEIDDDGVTKAVHELLRDNDLWDHLETSGMMTIYRKQI